MMHFFFFDSLLYYAVYLLIFIPFVIADSRIEDPVKCKFHMTVGVLLLCVFAGARGTSVGTDTLNMLKRYFYSASGFSGISEVIRSAASSREPAYLVLSWLLQRVSGSAFIFQFTMQLLTTGPIAVIAYRRRRETQIFVTMFIFVGIFYQESFNVARQCAAVSFMLLGFCDLMEGKPLRALLLAWISTLLHTSSYIGLIMYAVIFVFVRVQNPDLKNGIRVLGLLAAAALVIFWRQAAIWLTTQTELFEQYDEYTTSFMYQTGGYGWFDLRPRTVFDEVLRVVGVIYPVVLLSGEKYRGNPLAEANRIALLGSLAIYSFFVIAFETYMGFRLSVFLDYFWILGLGMIAPRSHDGTGPGVVLSISGEEFLVLGFSFLYNFLMYMMLSLGNTVPYTLMF